MAMYYKVGRPRDILWKSRMEELNRRLEDSQKVQVRCASCGRRDNDWPPRHGLRCRCWCRLLNKRLKEGMTLAEAEADAAKEAEAIKAGNMPEEVRP